MDKPLFYIYLQFKLKEQSNKIGELSYKEAAMFLRFYNIPKQLRKSIIDEMIQLKLIRKVNRFTVQVAPCGLEGDLEGMNRFEKRQLYVDKIILN